MDYSDLVPWALSLFLQKKVFLLFDMAQFKTCLLFTFSLKPLRQFLTDCIHGLNFQEHIIHAPT